jgi:hypothetical protein
MVLLVLLAMFVFFNAVAWRWGVDSRDGLDWVRNVPRHDRG